MFKNVPSGLGSKGKIRLREGEIDDVLDNGARWLLKMVMAGKKTWSTWKKMVVWMMRILLR